MTFSLRIRPAADHDIDAAAAYIAQDSVEQAFRVYDSIDETFRLIREAPQAWPIYELIDHPRLAGVRRRPVVGFQNYLVFYLLSEGIVDVLRVLHGARDIPAVLGETTKEESDD